MFYVNDLVPSALSVTRMHVHRSYIIFIFTVCIACKLNVFQTQVLYRTTDVSGTANDSYSPPSTDRPYQLQDLSSNSNHARSSFLPTSDSRSAVVTVGTGRWCASNIIYDQVHRLISKTCLEYESAAAGCGW